MLSNTQGLDQEKDKVADDKDVIIESLRKHLREAKDKAKEKEM